MMKLKRQARYKKTISDLMLECSCLVMVTDLFAFLKLLAFLKPWIRNLFSSSLLNLFQRGEKADLVFSVALTTELN